MVFSEASEHFTNMVMMEIGIVGVDEDVVQVYEDANIEEVAKNVVHEPLKGGWRIGESERHYTIRRSHNEFGMWFSICRLCGFGQDGRCVRGQYGRTVLLYVDCPGDRRSGVEGTGLSL